MSQLKPLVVGADGRPARIQSGDVLDPAYLATGTRDGTRFLRDDGTYAVPTVVGGTNVVTCTVAGSITMPYDGTVRRYFREARAFTNLTIGVTVVPSSNTTITIKKNGTSAATLQLISNNNYATGAISFSVAPGDYITAHMSGGDTSDAVITLE